MFCSIRTFSAGAFVPVGGTVGVPVFVEGMNMFVNNCSNAFSLHNISADCTGMGQYTGGIFCRHKGSNAAVVRMTADIFSYSAAAFLPVVIAVA